MAFHSIDRNLIKMVFARGLVTEMTGTYMEGTHERRWQIIFRPKNIFRDDEFYDVGLSGTYEWVAAETLDEAFNALQTMMEEVKVA